MSAIAPRVASREFGLNPDKDVTMLQVGGSPQRVAAQSPARGPGSRLDSMSGLRLIQTGIHRARAGEPEVSLFGAGGACRGFCGKIPPPRRPFSRPSSKASRASNATARKASRRWLAT